MLYCAYCLTEARLTASVHNHRSARCSKVELGSIMAGHGVTLPRCVAIARHAGSPCPRILLNSCFDPHLVPSEHSLVCSESTTYIVRCSLQTSSRHHQGTWEAELWVEAGIWPAQ